MNKQAFNPFLPLNEYIPDGEPHVFGDRIYLYGSHDKEGGHTFCMLDYTVYSAPVADLSDWRCEGVIYHASQDPIYDRFPYMYAPDVVRGNDGRYYLYYCMSGEYGQGGYTNPISVAVCDSPAGQYTFLGHVRHADGTPMKRYICFDPAVMNDRGVIRLYYGTQYDYEEREDFATNPNYLKAECEMFGRSREEILSYPDSIMGPIVATLEDDMLTIREEPKHLIPYAVRGTGFAEHPFFEAASMRRVGEKYYFIYSSWLNHELCYATSDYPDREFTFGGTIVSNGDIGYQGRNDAEKLNMTGTTHGSIEEVNGAWYVFYHRLTHKSDYSRQACAERIEIAADGSIAQVEITSCGLNGGPLVTHGVYPAVIACNITNGHMPHGSNSVYATSFPNVTNDCEERFIAEIAEGTLIGYKYFDFAGVREIVLQWRPETEATRVRFEGPLRLDERCEKDKGEGDVIDDVGVVTAEDERSWDGRDSADGGRMAPDGMLADFVKEARGQQAYFEVRLTEHGESAGRIELSDARDRTEPIWRESAGYVDIPDGVHALYLIYHGTTRVQLKTIDLRG